MYLIRMERYLFIAAQLTRITGVKKSWHLIVAAFLMMMACSPVITGNTKSATKTIQPEIVDIQVDNSVKMARLVFDSSHYHFGQIRQGELLYKEIYFSNQGTVDLVIDLISACECATLDWSRLPIAPGMRSTIKIKYDSKDTMGTQIVDIDVLANTDPVNTYTKFSLFVDK